MDHYQAENTSDNKYKVRSTSTLPSNVPYTSCVKILHHKISMSLTVTSTVYGTIYSPHFILLYAVSDNKTYYSVFCNYNNFIVFHVLYVLFMYVSDDVWKIETCGHVMFQLQNYILTL
jgi:hypothetical protein